VFGVLGGGVVVGGGGGFFWDCGGGWLVFFLIGWLYFGCFVVVGGLGVGGGECGCVFFG